jgi:hypothetical protein
MGNFLKTVLTQLALQSVFVAAEESVRESVRGFIKNRRAAKNGTIVVTESN